jgi:dTDP-4-dehydrorhamnose reductase
MVADSKALHLRQLSGMISILTETNPIRLKYHHYLIRNQMYVARLNLSKLDLFRHVVRQFQLLFRLLRSREFQKARIVWAGMVASQGFHPTIESADAPLSSLGATVRRMTSIVVDSG